MHLGSVLWWTERHIFHAQVQKIDSRILENSQVMRLCKAHQQLMIHRELRALFSLENPGSRSVLIAGNVGYGGSNWIEEGVSIVDR